ncbi:hypothetical protein MLD52_07665 [Puniceicoccaceae bacterium K14]|nr:hypothetical protein [Puniceicoccaceae bacterium K14]
MTIPLPKAVLAWILLATFLCNCSKEQISVYDAPKESNSYFLSEDSDRNFANTHSELAWAAPIEWESLQPTALSKNRYRSLNEQGRVFISISALPGAAASFVQNAKLLARQIGLSTPNQQQISELTEIEEYASLPASKIQLTNRDASLTAKSVAFIQENRVWYFTLRGESNAVEAESARFYSMLESIQVTRSSEKKETNDFADYKETVDFPPPEGWVADETGPLRIASFKIERIGIQPADFSITRFHNSESNLYSNINRWRRQLRLEPWTKQRFEQRARTINTDKYSFKTYDLKAESASEQEAGNERMFIAVVNKGEHIYYFKLRGDALLLETQRRNFLDILKVVSINSAQIATTQ